MAISIRDCLSGDLAAITAIYADAVRHGTASFELEPPDLAEMTRRQRRLVEDGFPYLVAEEDGVVLGYAYAGPFRPRPAYRYAVEDSVYVAAGVQRRGVGRRLLAALMVRCAEAGFRQMIAVIGDSPRQDSSIALHAALGFRTIGRIEAVGYKHGQWLDSLYMQAPLGPGASAPPG